MRTTPDSFQGHLRLWLTVVFVGLYALSAVCIFLFMRHALLTQMDRHLSRLAQDFIAETERLADGTLVFEFHELNLPDYRSGNEQPNAFYELRNIEGQAILKSPSLVGSAELPFRAQPKKTERIFRVELPTGRDGRAVAVWFVPKPAQREDMPSEFAAIHEPVCLTIAESTSSVDQTLLLLAATLAVTAGILAMVTLLLIGLLVAQVCRPMTELGTMTAAIRTDNLDARLPTDQLPLELRPLILQFNQLIARAADAIQREKRFSIDIAHELRTPISEMHLLMQLGADSGYPNVQAGSMEDPREIYRLGGEITGRINKILETLTALHRGEHNSDELSFETVSGTEILHAATSVFPLEVSTRFRFGKDPDTISAKFFTDPDLLRAVLDNLLSNAVAHSPAGSPIRMSVSEGGLSIQNETRDLSEDDLQRLTEPFWQKDTARVQQDHFGLGLSLVALYVRLLQGSLTHSLQDGNITARLELPTDEREDS